MSPDSDNQQTPSIRPANALSKKLVRYILGFGVGIGTGLAPYLGILNVPLFKPLLSLIPNSIQNTVIPLSAALMGLVAVVVQWYAGERVTKKWMRKMFALTLITAATTFIILTVVHTLVVVTLPIEDNNSLSFIVGFTRPVRPPCTEDVSDEQCIMLLSANPARIASFWGNQQVRLARLALIFSYLFFTGSFGVMVGLIILKEAMQKSADRS